MHLVARQATSDDFETMLQLCPNGHESAASRRACWDAIWSNGHTFGVVVHDLASRHQRNLAMLVGTFVTPSFVNQAVTAKTPGLLKLVVQRIERGEQPFIQHPELGEKNATEGLNLMLAYLGWHGQDYDRDPAPSLRAIAYTAFLDRHAGHRLRFMFGETCGEAATELATRTGFEVLNDYESWASRNTVSEERPFLMGVAREVALRKESQWLGRLFTYFPPRFHFTDHQRQILLLARDGYTDNEIAGVLGARAEAIKKRWASIYDRVNEVFPDLLPVVGENGRGAEKRRALLVHLRDRPEELRPFTRRAA